MCALLIALDIIIYVWIFAALWVTITGIPEHEVCFVN